MGSEEEEFGIAKSETLSDQWKTEGLSRRLSRGLAPVSHSNFHEGQRVIAMCRAGYIRFVGPTSFAAGRWVGIELDEPVGKNNGSVKGVSYFKCDANRGMFVRPAQVRLISEDLTRANE